jgi:branched-chain amino acid transport system permease protein
MTTSISTSEAGQDPITSWIRANLPLVAIVLILAVLPFVIGLVNGDSITDVLSNESGNSKFIQGLLIEVFILGVYAISYDLVLGITGLLSFGHAMFFAVGAYLTGILLKSFGWTLLPTIVAVILAGIVQAVLFAIVLPRVKGLTFARWAWPRSFRS